MTKTLLLSDGWQFAKSDLQQATPAGLDFMSIDLPHDWLIYDTQNLYEDSIGWYKRHLDYNGTKHVFLYFEGIYMDCSLFVNGTWIGDWKYGYSSFEYEITHALKAGKNEILIKVIHQTPNSRWYSGAGIYRDVWLKLRNTDYIVTNGLYISSKPKDGRYDAWNLELECEVMMGSQSFLELGYSILAGNQILANCTQIISPQQGIVVDRQKLLVENVQVWGPENPHLYELVVTLTNAKTNKVLETFTQKIGFKEVILDPRQGLFLNGQRTKLKGVCEHHDLGALGAAFSKSALKYRFELLKTMGVNAIRIAHNMPAKGFMELADQMGFLIVSEAFDMWERSKTKYDYARFFEEWVKRDVASWIRRDRNHPSLLMWSIGNEVFDTHVGSQGEELTKYLVDLVLAHDPKRNGFVTFGSNYLPWENTQSCAQFLDAVGYNYGPGLYQEHHEKFPHWVIYGSETSAVVQSRGIYHFPLEQPILADDDRQCSALGNSPVSWGAKSTQECLAVEDNTPFSLGQFIWTGFDYLGEPTPYHTKNSYFGQIDTAGFPKDSYYIYQAAWTDYEINPMVHLYPYWDFSPGQIIDVQVCSNAPLVVLELNGEEIGRQDMREPEYLYVANWKVPYQAGELRALALNEEGQTIASHVRHSFGDACKIRLHANRDEMEANGRELIFVQISMEDRQGNPVENATNRVEVKVSGAGRLVGLDNGDSTDYDAYKGTSKRLFSGKLMAIVASCLEPGEIKVEVASPGIPTQTAYFQSQPSAGSSLQGISALQANHDQPVQTGRLGEVPVRKIELIVDEERLFTPGRNEIMIRPKLHPKETTYKDLSWRVVSNGGIDSKLATLEMKDDQVRLAAKGDGHFRLRCLSKNGTDSIRLFSELEFEARGFGKLYKNPYEFVTGGLYDDAVGEVGTGNERGVATARGEETQVGFLDLDFGWDGSDTITIPFFALTSEAYPVQIWEGKPHSMGSLILADVIYQRPTKWNVYQNVTYKLNKRLRGITSLWIVTQNKMHIKGFYFARQNRTFSRIIATEYDDLYGDHFVLKDDKVEEIGNNVTLDFGELDFGREGGRAVTICGRTALDKTMIQISFTGSQGEVRQQVEFVQTDNYEKQNFALQPVYGKQKVRLIFLPGSQFDLAWLQFASQLKV